VAYGACEDTSFDIYLIRLKNPRTPPESGPEPFLKGAFGESQGQISPDGRWMLYGSDQSGRWECYVTSYPKPGSVHQISRSGMRDPRWNRRGTEIVYMEGTGLYAVDVTPGPEFRAGEPRLLFEGPYVDVPGFSFDVSPDGQEFLMLENKEILTPSKSLTVVTNFFDELRRRVPAGRAR
jgi:Tol biopolymer transport system component